MNKTGLAVTTMLVIGFTAVVTASLLPETPYEQLKRRVRAAREMGGYHDEDTAAGSDTADCN